MLLPGTMKILNSVMLWAGHIVSHIIFAEDRSGDQPLGSVRNRWRNIIHGSQIKWVRDL